jgi:signal transduction histidine kinase
MRLSKNLLRPLAFFVLALVVNLCGAADAGTSPTGISVFTPTGAGKQSLSGYLTYLDDMDGSYTIDDVTTVHAKQFQPLTGKKKLGYDHQGKALWIRFEVDSRGHSGPWFLSYDYEHVSNLQFYSLGDKGWKKTEFDASLPNDGRLIKTRQYVVPIDPENRAGTSVHYVRFEPAKRFLAVPLSWSGAKGLIEAVQASEIAHGLFFGALLSIWLYNFALLLFLRDKLYLYYTYYLGCFIATFLYIYGVASLFVNSSPLVESLFAAAGYGAIHGLIIFTRHFLSLAETFKWVDRYLRLFQWLLLIGMVAAFFQPIGQPYRVLNVIILLTLPVMAVMGVVRARVYQPARLYSLGWAVFAVALSALAARSLNLVSSNLITTYGVMFASVWEAVLFSLALGYRIKLTEAQATDERLRALEIEKQATRAKEQFLTMISHELRSPLSSVSLGLDMLELRAGDNKQTAAVSRIRRAADALELQLRDVLTLASGNQGTLEIRPLAFEAVELIAGVAEEQRAAANAKGLKFEVVAPAAPIHVIADPVRIAQVLRNLVSNAIKYTESGGIRVELQAFDEDSGTLHFKVADTGAGIPAEVLPLVFAPFRRFGSLEGGREGSGIGLAVVQTVLQQLGGTVEVASRAGAGATFTVAIPAMLQPSEIPEDNATQKILVVDDNPDLLNALVSLIAELGYKVDQALGPAAGANLLASTAYDVALIDLDMPIKPGKELAAETRRGGGPNSHAWFIAFTAGTQVAEGTGWPFNAFFQKPVDLRTLRAAIADGIRGSRSHAASVLQTGTAEARPPEWAP